MITVLNRGSTYLQLRLSGVKSRKYIVKIGNQTKSNLDYNSTIVFTGLSPGGTHQIRVSIVPLLYNRVVIRNNSKKEPLSLAEVEVYDHLNRKVSHNRLLVSKVSQTDTAHNGHASRAVDGNTSGVWSNNSVTHTSSGGWRYWELKFRTNVSIKEVKIYNRAGRCGSKDCRHRLSGSVLRLYNSSGKVAHAKTLNGNMKQVYKFNA